MTEIDLDKLPNGLMIDSIDWLVYNYGPMSEGRWKIKGLRYLQFKNSADATFYLLKWQ